MVVKSASLAVNIEQFWPFLTSSYFIYEQSYHLCSASQMMVLVGGSSDGKEKWKKALEEKSRPLVQKEGKYLHTWS